MAEQSDERRAWHLPAPSDPYENRGRDRIFSEPAQGVSAVTDGSLEAEEQTGPTVPTSEIDAGPADFEG